MSLIWASVGNCGNQHLDDKGEMQETEISSVRVPMQEAGAEQPVVAMKQL